MIRWEHEGDDWVGLSGELPVAKVAKDVEAERESWTWQIHAVKRPNGWRKPLGHRTTSLDARRSAEEYWAKWLAATALQPDVAQLARGSLALEGSKKRRTEKSRRVIAGRASVIDGDTIDIHGRRIRLFGVDAPESSQTCSDEEGKTYRCGQRAAQALDDRISGGVVGCEPQDRDRYGRVVAICRAHGEDLSAWMVGLGWALAFRRYSERYVSAEDLAKLGRRDRCRTIIERERRRGRIIETRRTVCR